MGGEQYAENGFGAVTGGVTTTGTAQSDRRVLEQENGAWFRVDVPEGGEVRRRDDGLVNVMDADGWAVETHYAIKEVHPDDWKTTV